MLRQGAMPQRLRMKFVYREEFDDTIASGQRFFKPFRANSAYDPNYNVGGHTCYGWALWAVPNYSNYRVWAAKMEVTIRNQSFSYVNAAGTDKVVAQVPTTLMCIIVPDKNPVPLAYNMEDFKNRQLATYCYSDNVRKTHAKTTNYCSMWKIDGENFTQWLADPNVQAAVTTNPSTGRFFNIYIDHPEVSDTNTQKVNVAFNIAVKITYWVELFTRVNQPLGEANPETDDDPFTGTIADPTPY